QRAWMRCSKPCTRSCGDWPVRAWPGATPPSPRRCWCTSCSCASARARRVGGRSPALLRRLGAGDALDPGRARAPARHRPARRRQIVELRWLAGMEFAEIASMLDISERTVYREWDRARAFLQAMLDDEAGGGACDGA